MGYPTVDDIITQITGAPEDGAAQEIMLGVRPGMVLEVADQLHIDTTGHALAWIRTAVVEEARA